MIVNNAGIVQGKKILDLSEEEINEYVQILHFFHPISLFELSLTFGNFLPLQNVWGQRPVAFLDDQGLPSSYAR
jgi:hypothetical protein